MALYRIDCTEPVRDELRRIGLPPELWEAISRLRVPPAVVRAASREEAEAEAAELCRYMLYTVPVRLVRVKEVAGGCQSFTLERGAGELTLFIDLDLDVEGGPRLSATLLSETLWLDDVVSLALWAGPVEAVEPGPSGSGPVPTGWDPRAVRREALRFGAGGGWAVVEAEVPVQLWRTLEEAGRAGSSLEAARRALAVSLSAWAWASGERLPVPDAVELEL